MKHFALFAILLAAATFAPFLFAADTVTSTRVSAYDFQAQDTNGAKISDHTRFDTALIACLNNPACVYVAGGKYKITRTTSTPAPPPPPTPTGTAALTWTAPTRNTDGTALTDLAGYRIYHGISPTALTDIRQVPGATVLAYNFTALTSGTHYFAIAAYNAAGVESVLSAVGTKVVP